MSKIVKIVNKKKIKMLVRSCFLITLIKCLKGHKCLGSLCNVKSKSYWVTEWLSELVTRSPIELLWTAKNNTQETRHLNTLHDNQHSTPLLDLPALPTVHYMLIPYPTIHDYIHWMQCKCSTWCGIQDSRKKTVSGIKCFGPVVQLPSQHSSVQFCS